MNSTNQSRRVYTVAEVQDLLGIGRTTVWKHVNDGTISSLRLGGRVLVPCEVIDRLLATQSEFGEQSND